MIVNLGNVKAAHKRFLAANERMVSTVMDRTATFAKSYVYQHPKFRRRSGRLQDETRVILTRISSDHLLTISNPVEYARFVEFGTRPHVISAKNMINGYLRFKGKRGWVRKFSVKHPGTKPTRFLWRSLWASGRIVDANLRQDMARIASKF